MKALKVTDSPQGYKQALACAAAENWESAEFFHLLHEYYSAMEDEPYQDHSVFACNAKGEPVALAVACDAGGEINYYRMPIALAWSPALKDEERDKASVALVKRLLADFEESDASAIQFAHSPRHGDPGGLLSVWHILLAQSGAAYHPGHRGVIDLARSEQEIWRDVRKSYRSLINGGRKSMAIRIMDKTNAEQHGFSVLQAFHERIAGRQTRSQASWDKKFEMLQRGLAEMIMAYHEDRLIGCTYVFFDEVTTQYATGVYERSLFDKPISHYPMYVAIQRAKARNNRWFNMGDVLLPPGSDAKLRDIAVFKKGFTSRIEVSGFWRLQKEDF